MAAVVAAPEPWGTVAPRKKRSAGRRPRRDERRAEPEADSEAVLRRLREAEEDLWNSDFCDSALETITQCLRKQLEQLQDLREALGRLTLSSSPGGSGESSARSTSPVRCVCYGLGNFASSVTARSQLAFMLLFLEKCQIPRSHCQVYDPLFSQAEVSVLTSLGVTVLCENEEGKRSTQGQPTIFYMPHCGTALYNNLLWSNWSIDALSRVVIIGNSFQCIEERLLARILQKNYPYIAKVSHRIVRVAGDGVGGCVPHYPLMFLSIQSIMYWQGPFPGTRKCPIPFILRVSPAFPLPSGLKSIDRQIPIYFSKGQWGCQ
uniref:SRR1 domain containing n=1 Tax=Cricetulus griseus TaxID=10029 RepID=A0A8C2MEK0_CRIGR